MAIGISRAGIMSALSVLALALPAIATDVLPRPADPFADPKHDPYNPLKYIASDVLTGIAVALVVIVAVIQTYWTHKWGAKWMLSLVIGEYTFAVGLAARFGLARHPESKTIYGIEYLFVVLSPCAFIAADYILLGRMARHLDCARYLIVPARKIAIIFIASDITTFLIQAAGGVISISAATTSIKTLRFGGHVFLAGLAAQLFSFLMFTLIFLLFLYRVRKHEPEIWHMDAGKRWFWDWRALASALFVSCIGILIRSIYRTVELSQGFDGDLTTVEAYFYGLDTLPLVIAIWAYVPFWPGRFIRHVEMRAPSRAGRLEMTEGSSTGKGSSSTSVEKVPENTL